jgi:hypothetical protein
MTTRSFIRTLLFAWGIICFISAGIYIFTEPHNNWLWFSRFGLSVICFGFWTIGGEGK